MTGGLNGDFSHLGDKFKFSNLDLDGDGKLNADEITEAKKNGIKVSLFEGMTEEEYNTESYKQVKKDMTERLAKEDSGKGGFSQFAKSIATGNRFSKQEVERYLSALKKDLKADAERYKLGWQRDFAPVKNAEGFWNKTKALAGAVVHRTHEGFKSLDTVNPLVETREKIKDAIRESKIGEGFNSFTDYMDQLADDGDDEKLSLAERIWDATKGVGNGTVELVDFLTSTEGIEITLILIATGGIAAESLGPETMARLAPAINALTTTGGVALTGKGVYDVATGETHEEVQKGGGEILAGGMMIGAGAATAKSSLDAARHAGVAAKDPTTLNTVEAMVENFRVAPQGVKIAMGLQAPVMGAAIPASAIPMVSKPNQVEAYVNTGKADGIVFEGADGKLYVPNKWSPAEPYEVKPGSVIMIYDEAGGDFAVCDPEIFAKTYVGNTSGQYNAMQGVEAGQRISATKQAVGGVEIVSEGTVVQTLEGPRTVGAGEVVCYDVDGNPYVSPLKNVLKRNTGFSDEAMAKFVEFDPVQACATPEGAAYIKATNPQQYIEIITPQKLLETPEGTAFLQSNNPQQYIKVMTPEKLAETPEGAKFLFEHSPKQARALLTEELPDGGYKMYSDINKTFVVEEGLPNGTVTKYSNGLIESQSLPNGRYRTYKDGHLYYESHSYQDYVDLDPKCMTGRGFECVSRTDYKYFNPDGKVTDGRFGSTEIELEYHPNGSISKFVEGSNSIIESIIEFDEAGNVISGHGFSGPENAFMRLKEFYGIGADGKPLR